MRLVVRVHDVEVGPDAGFDALFEEQYPKLVSLGTALSGNREIAKELAQETMLRALRNWNDVRRFDRPDAWLRKVMTNLLIDRQQAWREFNERLDEDTHIQANPVGSRPFTRRLVGVAVLLLVVAAATC